MKKSLFLTIFALASCASMARNFDANAFGQTMREVQRTVTHIEQTMQPPARVPDAVYSVPAPRQSFDNFPPPQMAPSPVYAPAPVYASNSSSKFTPKLSFRESMGPVAGHLSDALEWIGDRVVNPVAEWVHNLDDDKRLLFLVLLVAGILAPILIVIAVARRSEDSLKTSKGAAGCAALAGAIFTIWGGFEIGGSIGEWLAIAIMVLLGLSFLLSVIGGLLCGKSIVFKSIAPFMLLEMSLAVFVLAMIITTVFIVIAIVVIVLSVIVSAADSNTIYRCPDCGRTFRGKPSSCPCGARFE